MRLECTMEVSADVQVILQGVSHVALALHVRQRIRSCRRAAGRRCPASRKMGRSLPPYRQSGSFNEESGLPGCDSLDAVEPSELIRC